MQTFLNELRFYVFRWRLNFRNLHALKMSFWMNVIGIIIGNMIFYVSWLFLMHAIGPVNGWGVVQTLGMLAFNMLSFGFCWGAFGSQTMLQPRIQTGSFDSFLSKPKNLYIRIINDQSSPSVLGWILQGTIGLSIFFALTDFNLKILFFIIIMMPPAVMAQTSFLMVTDCVAFWLPYSQGLGKSLNELMMASAGQPLSLLQGGLRFFYIAIVPSLIIAGLPIELITYNTTSLIAIAYGVTLCWLMLSVWVLKISVRRYESGNMIG